MEEARDTQPVIMIRVVGSTGIGRPRIGVLIDGQNVGNLDNKEARSFRVVPGIRKVMVMVDTTKSETWDLDMSPGNLVALECGFDNPKFLITLLLLLSVGPISALLRLPLLGVVAYIGAIPLMIGRAFTILNSGGRLYLRPQFALPVPGVRTPPETRPYRMTIWKVMVAVLVIAVMLAVLVQDRIARRKAAYERQRNHYQFLADLYAKDEIFWAGRDEEMARLEEAEKRTMLSLLESVNSNPDDLDPKRKLEKKKQQVERIQRSIANHARMTAYYARLKEKYLKAAALPFEPVVPDPPPPP